MASTNKLASAFFGFYDKLIALVGIVVLGIAAFLFATGRAASEKDGKAFQRKISNLSPAHPDVADVSARVASYAVPFSRIAKPFQISPERERKAGFFTPEMRVWCVRNDCRFPLAPDWNKCPICGTEQIVKPVETINADSDGDGMPDDWERKHGLNPQDPSDAALDSDEDGFTNLQEFQDGTDPLDAKSHTDFATLLRVAKIEATILPLKFTGASRMPNGKYKCQFNYSYENPVSKRREVVTLWINEGEPIDNPSMKIMTGFSLVSLNEDAEEVENKSTGLKVKRPTVTIARGKQEFTLSQDKVANDTDYIITLVKDFGDRGEITLDGGKDFKIGDKVYHVVSADKEAMKVVIRSEADKSEVTLTRDGASK